MSDYFLKKFMFIVFILLVIGAGLAMSGCQEQLNITPTVATTNLATQSIVTFQGNIDGVDYYVPDAEFTCVNGELIRRADGSVVMGADSVVDTCSPSIVVISQTAMAQLPLLTP